jgi:hypothetical protein
VFAQLVRNSDHASWIAICGLLYGSLMADGFLVAIDAIDQRRMSMPDL